MGNGFLSRKKNGLIMALTTRPHIAKMLGKIAAIFLFPFSALMTYYGATFIFYKYFPPPEHHSYMTYVGKEVNTTADLISLLDEGEWPSWALRPPFLAVLIVYKKSCSQ